MSDEDARLEPTPPTPASVAFVDPLARQRTFELKYPVTIGGKVFAAVHLHRLTVAEVAAFFEGIKGGAPDGAMLPFYRDVNGDALPQEVFDALDDDDAYAIEQGLADFLPRRLLAVMQGAGGLPAGAPIASSSAK